MSEEIKSQGPGKDLVMLYLSEVQDPDLRLSIVELGLIYNVEIEPAEQGSGYKAKVDMTLTSPACPVAPQIQAAVHSRLLQVPEVVEAEVKLVFSPLWDPRVHASEDVQMQLGIF